MNVVAFYGSPRIHGNTELLLEEALKPVQEAGHQVITFKLNFMNIKPCQNCSGCEKTGVCIINDDMKEVYDAIRAADRVILASPIFFFGLSAQSKAMIDRCQSFWCDKYLMKKAIPAGPHGRKGLLIMVGGMKKEDGLLGPARPRGGRPPAGGGGRAPRAGGGGRAAAAEAAGRRAGGGPAEGGARSVPRPHEAA